MMEQNGFEVVYANVDGDVPFLSLFLWIPRGIRSYIFRGLTTVSKGLFGGQLFYVVKVVE